MWRGSAGKGSVGGEGSAGGSGQRADRRSSELLWVGLGVTSGAGHRRCTSWHQGHGCVRGCHTRQRGARGHSAPPAQRLSHVGLSPLFPCRPLQGAGDMEPAWCQASWRRACPLASPLAPPPLTHSPFHRRKRPCVTSPLATTVGPSWHLSSDSILLPAWPHAAPPPAVRPALSLGVTWGQLPPGAWLQGEAVG